jgi:hypothetical protein
MAVAVVVVAGIGLVWLRMPRGPVSGIRVVQNTLIAVGPMGGKSGGTCFSCRWKRARTQRIVSPALLGRPHILTNMESLKHYSPTRPPTNRRTASSRLTQPEGFVGNFNRIAESSIYVTESIRRHIPFIKWQ